MDQLDDLLKTMKHTKSEPLPVGFEHRVLDKWFEQRPEVKTDYSAFIYAAAACLIAFTCINILSLQLLNASIEEASVDTQTTIEISSEAEFAEAYGLTETTTYYTLNK